MRVFAVGNWAHFGSLVVSLAMLGFGLTSAVMSRRQGLVPAQLARGRHGLARPVRAARGRRQPLRPASRLQRDLPRLRPGAEVEAAGDLPRRADAVPRRRGLPRLRVPEEQPHFRPRLFRRSRRLRPLRPRVPAGDVCVHARQPDRRAAGAVARRLLRLGVRPGRARALIPFLCRWRCRRSPAISSLPPRSASRRSRSTTTRACPTRANSRTRKRSTRAPRRSAFSRPIRAPICISRRASPTTPASTCRRCPPTPISASISTATARSASCAISPTKRRPISASCRCSTPMSSRRTPKTFITQFGGGISTEVALHSGAKDVTVAEGNRAILEAFHGDVFRKFTGDILSKVRVIDYEGRHFLAHTDESFDVIDLSLADSVGLSNPGGFAIVEKFPYTQEAMETYMRALAPGGVLSVTIWNKEEPPKSVLKLYATMAAAARAVDPAIWPIRSSSPRPICRPRPCSTSAAASRPKRSRSCASTRTPCRSMRSIRRASSTTVADHEYARRLCRADFRWRRGRPAAAQPAQASESDAPHAGRRRPARPPSARPTTACCPRP